MADEPIATTPVAAEQGAPTPEGTTPAAQPENVAAQPNANGGGQQPGAKTFTQEELNAIVAERIKQAQRKATEAAEKAQAEARGEFEKLYKQTQAELEAERNERKALELQALRRQVADKVQLPAALVDRLRGDTEADIEADAKSLLAALPKPSAPNINATGGNATGTAANDDALTAMAVRLGVSPDKFKQNYRGI